MMPLTHLLARAGLAVLTASPALAATPLTTEQAVALLARTPHPVCDGAALQVTAAGTRNPAQLGCAFDQQGAAVEALLAQAARKGPVGAVVTFALSIAPDGRVSDVRIVEGSASVRAFAAELAAAIAQFRFPAQAVPLWSGTYTRHLHSH